MNVSPAPRRRFAPTRWSLVVAAGNSSSAEARAALAALCETYWSPVYDFVRHGEPSADDARDLTQAFFARVIEKGDFRNARRELGRFRTFLLTAVSHFLANHAEHDRAAKRGGGQVHVPIDALANSNAGEDRQHFSEPASGETPETIYERRWVLTALEAAMTRLERECSQQGRQRLFDQLRPFLTGDDASYAACAQALEITEGSVRVALHRLRRQFGQCLCETLAETAEDPAEVDQEFDYLLAVMSRPPASA